MFAIDELKKAYPNANYHHLTLIGHSNGGDISMYFAKLHPDLVRKVVTLDNLRVPFITDGKIRNLSFRSRDPVFKADPGVVPDDDICAKAGIEVVRTQFQHNDLSDRGPDQVKTLIESKVQEFLDEVDQDDDNPFKLLPTTSADAGAATKPAPATAAPVAAAAPLAAAKN